MTVTTLNPTRVWHYHNPGRFPHRRLLTLHWVKVDAWYRRDLPDGGYLTVSRHLSTGGWFWSHTDPNGGVRSAPTVRHGGFAAPGQAQAAGERAAMFPPLDTQIPAVAG